MKKLLYLVKRNVKIYFKDKMLFFISLITPLILLVLFMTFLREVYEDSIISMLPEGVTLSKSSLNSFTGGWLFSSILAVSCITVSFCTNIYVMDKINHTLPDFYVSPVKKSILLTSYAIGNFITTFIVCFIVFLISLIYLSIVGFYMSILDILGLLLSLIICVASGSLFSSVIGFFISTQSAMSAVSTLVSSMYGFICGAYMPISQFGVGMQYFVSLLPGTYATVLFRHYYMNGVLNHMNKYDNIPNEVIEVIEKNFDGKMMFFKIEVPLFGTFLVVIISVIILFVIYILLANHKVRSKNNK